MRIPPGRPKTLARTAFLAALLLAVRAGARDLTEILTEKGALTPDEAAEAAKAPPAEPTIQYRQGSGFVFTTPGGNFQLATGVWGQFRYTLQDVDEDFTNAKKSTEDSQSFDVPRIRTYWKGHAFTPSLRYEIEVEWNASGGDLLRNVYGEYAILDGQWLTFRGGQWKVPFCREEMTPDSRQEFNERSVACQNFRFERARGIQLYGTPMNSLLEYYLGAFNTTGRNGPPNPDTNFLYVARLATSPLGAVGYSEGDLQDSPDPLFGVGASYGYERVRADGFTTAATSATSSTDPDQLVIQSDGTPVNRVPVQRMIQPYYAQLSKPGALTAELQNVEVDFAFRWHGAFVEAEYFKLFVHNDAWTSAAAPSPPFELPQSSFQAWGWYALAGYFVIPHKLEMALRYSACTPNQDYRVVKPNSRAIEPFQTELLGAVNYYFWGHDLKLMTDFGPISTAGVEAVDGTIETQNDFRCRIQAQMYF